MSGHGIFYDRRETITTPERLFWCERHVITHELKPHKIGDQLSEAAASHLLKAIREGWGPVGESWRTVQEWQAKHLAQGAWKCPACTDGWQGYNINKDGYGCPVCGYEGGPIP